MIDVYPNLYVGSKTYYETNEKLFALNFIFFLEALS